MVRFAGAPIQHIACPYVCARTIPSSVCPSFTRFCDTLFFALYAAPSSQIGISHTPHLLSRISRIRQNFPHGPPCWSFVEPSPLHRMPLFRWVVQDPRSRTACRFVVLIGTISSSVTHATLSFSHAKPIFHAVCSFYILISKTPCFALHVTPPSPCGKLHPSYRISHLCRVLWASISQSLFRSVVQLFLIASSETHAALSSSPAQSYFLQHMLHTQLCSLVVLDLVCLVACHFETSSRAQYASTSHCYARPYRLRRISLCQPFMWVPGPRHDFSPVYLCNTTPFAPHVASLLIYAKFCCRIFPLKPNANQWNCQTTTELLCPAFSKNVRLKKCFIFSIAKSHFHFAPIHAQNRLKLKQFRVVYISTLQFQHDWKQFSLLLLYGDPSVAALRKQNCCCFR